MASAHAIRLVVAVCVVCVSIVGIVLPIVISFNDSYPEYGVIIDAGSTGSRVHVYKWTHRQTETTPLVIEETEPKDTKKEGTPIQQVTPGISSYVSNPKGAGKSLQDLLATAASLVPTEYQKTTNIYLFATAGMRLLDKKDQTKILDAVRDTLASSVFAFESDNARVIPGEWEGIYGWLTVNYLEGLLDKGDPSKTIGALDLGGASTQVTFVPKNKPKEEGYTITLYGHKYNLYAHSYLGWGMEQATSAVYTNLADASGTDALTQSVAYKKFFKSDSAEAAARADKEVDNPCLNDGYNTTTTIDGVGDVLFVGTSDAAECHAQCVDILELNETCKYSSCAVDGVYMPPLAGNFYAFSGFYYTPQLFGILDNATLALIKSHTDSYCSDTWTEVTTKFGNGKNEAYLPGYCFSGNYITALLHNGYGFAMDATTITYLSTIKDTDVGWALGAMLSEADILPVGPTRVLYEWWGVLVLTLSSLTCIVATVVTFYEVRLGAATAAYDPVL